MAIDSSPTHPFDDLRPEDLHEHPINKWASQPEGVLPLTVADMDFPLAEPIREALREAVDCGLLCYPLWPAVPDLREAAGAWYGDRHGMTFAPGEIHPISGLVPGLHLSALALAGPGDEVVIQDPVYPPFRSAVERSGRVVRYAPLQETPQGFRLDPEALEAAITPATRLLMLCNPHNPTGRVFTREELEAVADVALRHRLWVVSDELHADLVHEGRHLPFASIDGDVAERTLTLFGPTKTFNIAGLGVGFAMSGNEALLGRFKEVGMGLVPKPNILAQLAARAAFRRGGPWLSETLAYLKRNRDLVTSCVERMPGVRVFPAEGTYLAWLDFREAGLGDDLGSFLVDEAKVALNLGRDYGPSGTGFVRLNFASSRGIVEEALRRIAAALAERAPQPG